VLGRSDARFNPEPETRIDLTVASGDGARRSEYESLVATLGPLYEPMPLADLASEDVEFLVREPTSSAGLSSDCAVLAL